MDWKTNFHSIVRDTDSNLARVKKRLDTSRHGHGHYTSSSSHMHSSPDLRSGDQYGDYGLYGGMSTSNHHRPTHSVVSVTGQTDYSPLPHSTDNLGMTPPTKDSTGHQSETVDHLTRTVQELERQNKFYQQQVAELKGDLRSRVPEASSDQNLERKLESWKSGMMDELLKLRDEVKLSSSRGETGDAGNSVMSEMQQLRSWVQEEMSYMRGEMDAIKNRHVHQDQVLLEVVKEQQNLHLKYDSISKSVDSLEHRLDSLFTASLRDKVSSPREHRGPRDRVKTRERPTPDLQLRSQVLQIRNNHRSADRLTGNRSQTLSKRVNVQKQMASKTRPLLTDSSHHKPADSSDLDTDLDCDLEADLDTSAGGLDPTYMSDDSLTTGQLNKELGGLDTELDIDLTTGDELSALEPLTGDELSALEPLTGDELSAIDPPTADELSEDDVLSVDHLI